MFLITISSAWMVSTAEASWTIKGLGNLGDNYSYPEAINDAGQMIGRSETSDFSMKSFITGPGGVGMSELGSLGGDVIAQGINDSGQVTGITEIAGGGAVFIFLLPARMVLV